MFDFILLFLKRDCMKQKVIVIGAGITGISCAEELRRSGAEVTLIDRVPAGDPSQSWYPPASASERLP